MTSQPSYFNHFILYSFSYLVYGLIFSAIGPLIPYLSEISQTPETSYTFVFFCRGMGVILGTISFKHLQSNKFVTLTLHQILALSSTGIFLMCLLFSVLDNYYFQGASFFFVGLFMGSMEVAFNLSVIKLSH